MLVYQDVIARVAAFQVAANSGVKVRDINFKALLGKEAGRWVCEQCSAA